MAATVAAPAKAGITDLPRLSESALQAGIGWYFEGHYADASDPVPVRQLGEKWTSNFSPRDGKNVAFSFGHLESGAQIRGFRLGVIRRRDAWGEVTRRTAELTHLQQSGVELRPGEIYEVDFRLDGFEAKGLRASGAWRHELPGGMELSWQAGVSKLEAWRVKQAELRGTVTGTAAGDARFDVSGRDADSRKTYLFITPGAASGSGYAADLAVRVQGSGGMRLEIAAQDVVGRIRWNDVPTTTAQARQGVVTRDPNGFLNFAPALSGTNQRTAFVQRLHPKWSVAWSMEFRGLRLELADLYHRDMHIPSIAIGREWPTGWSARLEHDLRFRTVGLAIRSTWFHVSLFSDSTKPDVAHAYGLQLGLALLF